MTTYGNENSGITGYEIGENYIDVEFRNSSVYRYSENSVGTDFLNIMKALARLGTQLNTFINKFARGNAERVA